MFLHRSALACLILGASCLFAVAEHATTNCEPIEGVRALLKPGRVLLLGELHGTVESPAFTREIACHAAAAGLDVVVALELSPAAQGAVDAFLESPGKPADREALLSGPMWQRSYQDGRNSRAMVELLEALRRLKREGRAVRVGLFDAQPPGGGQARERAMAQNLASSFEASPEAMQIVLTGHLHSRTTTPGNARSRDYEPMGYLLSASIGAERVISLDVSHAGGSAWICGPDCGVVPLRGYGTQERWSIVIDAATRPAGHHGWYGVGTITASPPAVGEHDAVASVPATPPTSARPEPVERFPAQTAEMLDAFQGSWQAYQYGSKSWTIDIDEQRFRGVLGPDDWYEGKIRLRSDTDPAQIDFMIEDCLCNYRGMTSKGIFRENGESIVLAAPQPGHPRPKVFNENDGRMVELRRVETRRLKQTKVE